MNSYDVPLLTQTYAYQTFPLTCRHYDTIIACVKQTNKLTEFVQIKLLIIFSEMFLGLLVNHNCCVITLST